MFAFLGGGMLVAVVIDSPIFCGSFVAQGRGVWLTSFAPALFLWIFLEKHFIA